MLCHNDVHAGGELVGSATPSFEHGKVEVDALGSELLKACWAGVGDCVPCQVSRSRWCCRCALRASRVRRAGKSSNPKRAKSAPRVEGVALRRSSARPSASCSWITSAQTEFDVIMLAYT